MINTKEKRNKQAKEIVHVGGRFQLKWPEKAQEISFKWRPNKRWRRGRWIFFKKIAFQAKRKQQMQIPWSGSMPGMLKNSRRRPVWSKQSEKAGNTERNGEEDWVGPFRSCTDFVFSFEWARSHCRVLWRRET